MSGLVLSRKKKKIPLLTTEDQVPPFKVRTKPTTKISQKRRWFRFPEARMGLVELLEVTVSGCPWDLSPAWGGGCFHTGVPGWLGCLCCINCLTEPQEPGEGRESWAQEPPKLSSQCKELGTGSNFSKPVAFTLFENFLLFP